MNNSEEHHNTYIIPPNFIEGGTLFGGMLKLRNVIEAGILAVLIGVPVFSLGLSLTTSIIILCLTALPLSLIALIGFPGESLSSFLWAACKWLKNRRTVTSISTKKKKPTVAEYLPIEKIENGIIYTRDHRYVKIIEVVPVNFLLRSARETKCLNQWCRKLLSFYRL